MSNKRFKLVLARMEAGYPTAEKFVDALRKEGLDIKLETYRNIESGRNKSVDVVVAFAIARLIKRKPEDIFLPNRS